MTSIFLVYYVVIFCAAVLLLLLFCLLFIVCRASGDDLTDENTDEQRQVTTSALTKLQRVFDWNKYSEHEECVICLLAFSDTDTVTPLPCDKRHYFHSACIEEWSKSHS